MKTIIVGLGNPILGDDGAGWKVVEEVQKQIPHILPGRPSPEGTGPQPGRGDGGDVDIECLSLGGIGLMEHLIGYDRAVIIDSFIAGEEEIGSILVRRLNDLPNYSAFHITSAHDTSLQNAIELGRRMGAHLPTEVTVIGIAIQSIRDFSEELSPKVAEAVPQAAHVALNLVGHDVIT
jgi:hydrogenase maturation protease